MAMQPKAWMTSNLFDKWISHFIVLIQAHRSNLCTFNWHLHILDGHNSRVTMGIVHKVWTVGLDLIIVPSHTSHTLRPLDVKCFKPFKIAFKSYKDVWTLANERKGVGKKDLASWMSLTIKKKHWINQTFARASQPLGFSPLTQMWWQKTCNPTSSSWN
jgi:hypothetical protein